MDVSTKINETEAVCFVVSHCIEQEAENFDIAMAKRIISQNKLLQHIINIQSLKKSFHKLWIKWKIPDLKSS